MSSPRSLLPPCGALPSRLAILAAAGVLASLPGAAQASPATTVADCLRPSQDVTAAATPPVLLPPGAAAPQLLAQALPGSRPASLNANNSTSNSRSTNPQLAQAIAQAPESLPACTYDPPLPEPPQVIRGLW